jgi:hypothetical protein
MKRRYPLKVINLHYWGKTILTEVMVCMIQIKYHLRMMHRIYSGFTQQEIYLYMLPRNRLNLLIICRHNIMYSRYSEFTQDLYFFCMICMICTILHQAICWCSQASNVLTTIYTDILVYTSTYVYMQFVSRSI